MKSRIKPRIAWEDRFHTPTLDELLEGYTKQHSQLIDQARQGVLALDSVTEVIAWHGIPWRWTLAYGIEGSQERPWAYIIPQPAKPLLALPLSGEFVETLPMRKLPKFVRDSIPLAPRVAGVHWVQWELTGKSQVDDLIALTRRKHEVMLAPAT